MAHTKHAHLKTLPVKGSPEPAVVDPTDYEWASKYSWYWNGADVCRSSMFNGREVEVRLSDEIFWRIVIADTTGANDAMPQSRTPLTPKQEGVL